MTDLVWQNERKKISDLIPAEYNPRRMTDKQKADLDSSLHKLSLADPIIINADNTVIGGHQRLKILAEKGFEEIDVRIPSRQLTLEEEKELNIRLNKNIGEWDEKFLTEHFDQRFLVNAGFDGDFVDQIFENEAAEDNFNEEEEYKKIDEAITKRGDLYVFKNGHRVMCGDGLSLEDVSFLMGGEKADLIYMDPPYNVNYRSMSGNSYSEGKFQSKKVFSDNLSPEDYQEFMLKILQNVFQVSHDYANIYLWFATKMRVPFRLAFDQSGFKFMQEIIWLKERFHLSHGAHFHRCYEPCMIGYKDFKKKYCKESDAWDLDRMTFEERLDVWFCHRDKAIDYLHPTQRPIRLHERAIKMSSEAGMIVLDLFGGSGSTLMCCEQLQRRAYVMELDPKYCDVILNRYQKSYGPDFLKEKITLCQK